MSFARTAARTVLTDRTGLLTTVGGLAAGIDHPILATVVVLRLVTPMLLVLYAGRGATPVQRISLIRGYLFLGACHGGSEQRRGQSRRRA